MSTARDTLLNEVEAFLAKHSMAPATFGKLAVGDPAFVLRLRQGRNPRIDTAESVRQFIRDYRPPTKRRPRAAHERAAA